MKRNILTIVAGAVMLVLAAVLVSCGLKDAKKDDAKSKSGKIVLNENIVTVKGGWVIEDEDQFFESVQGAYELTEKDEKLQITIDFKKTKEINREMEDFYMEVYKKDPDNYLSIHDNVKFQTDKTGSFQKLKDAKVGETISLTFTYLPADEKEKEKVLSNTSCHVYLILTEEDTADNDDGDDDDDDLSDLEDEWDKAYKKASDEYDKAYKKAQDDYDKAYKKAQKQMEDAMNSYSW